MQPFDKDKKRSAIIGGVSFGIVVILLVFGIIYHFLFNNKEKENPVEKTTVETTTGTTNNVDNNNTLQTNTELPSGESSVTQPVNNLADISKTVQEEQERKVAEENAKVDEYAKIVNSYIEAVNGDKDILPFIAEESIKKIKEITQKRFSAFSDTDKAEFVKDLQQLGYPNNSFDASSDSDLNNYINFIIKGGLKVDGKIVELKDVSGKFDATTNTFCGRFNIIYDGDKTKSIDSFCINKDKKFLIHSVN